MATFFTIVLSVLMLVLYVWSASLLFKRSLFKGIFPTEFAKFKRLSLFEKILTLFLLTSVVLYGGTKPSGSNTNNVDNVESPDEYGTMIASDTPMLLSAADFENIAVVLTNADFKITGFAVNKEEEQVEFRLDWTDTFIDEVDSRTVELFMVTNLVDTPWVYLARRLLAKTDDKNYKYLSLRASSVSAENRQYFRDALEDKGFFLFGSDIDTDNDRLTDAFEIFVSNTQTNNVDSDFDGVNDYNEVKKGFDPNVDNSGDTTDTDGDGLLDFYEAFTSKTDIDNSDSDEDGLTDYEEVITYNTKPNDADSDNDGLTDYQEKITHNTNPIDKDSDGDGLEDAEEISLGSDPNIADSDGDGLSDKWEHDNGFPFTLSQGVNNASDDPDNDGLTNLQEYNNDSDPNNPDTDYDNLTDEEELALQTNLKQPDSDGDRMPDGWEHEHGFNPITDNEETDNTNDDYESDPDGDGLINGEEAIWNCNPNLADTDGDGVSDGIEINNFSDPCDPTDGGESYSRVPVYFTFGDDSGSHSEKYHLELREVAFTPLSTTSDTTSAREVHWINAEYGECETRQAIRFRQIYLL